MSARLSSKMDNWDRIEDASPHYYGDNFPNGEITDFDYLKKVRGRPPLDSFRPRK